MVKEDILLYNSTYCRLCAEDNTNGISLFTEQEDLCMLINRYLPIKVENNDPFPKTICPGCHIQLEATKLFMDLIIDGQKKLRDLLKEQQDLLDREEKERQNLEEVLQNHNPNTSVETYTIEADENGEKFIIQIYSEGSLFPPNHELAQKAEGLDKPKRRRGRPPKSTTVTMDTDQPVKKVKSENMDYVPKSPASAEKETKEQNGNLGRKKRTIKAPVRYEGVVEGKELDKILQKEGVIDEEPVTSDEEIDIKKEELMEPPQTDDNPIGKIVTVDGDFVKPIFFSRRPPRIKKYGFRSKKYTCNVCKRDFIHQGRYELHKKSHKIKYVCRENDCQFQDEDKEVVVKHQEETEHSGISRIEPVDEINGTLLLPEVDESVKPETPEPPTMDSLKTADKSIKCPTCEKTFSCKQNYEVHLKAVHSGEKPYKCEVCQKLFAYACSLKNHMISHKNKEPDCDIEQYPCDKCDKLFQRPSSLIYHKDTEHGNQRFVCNKCNREFKHRQLLQRHQLVHSNERPFKCEDCGQTFKTRTNMINHENSHKGIKKFTCSVCGQCFLYKTSLAMHMRWHEGNKPFECDVCKKMFSQKGNLAEHKRIHTGEKPFTCETCGRSFTTSSQFKLHCKRHTGERPHGCEYCKKRFLHKETYDTHIRRHLDIRPFKCPHCPKSFTESWACSRHQKLHTGEKPYKCGVCDRAFSDASNFNKHTRLHIVNGQKTQLAIASVEKAKEVPNQPAPPAAPPPTMDLQILIPSQPQVTTEKDDEIISDITTGSLQIQELVDDDGNTISLTTADGQPIPIVSSGGNEKIQGLMPDGTLVSFDIFGGVMRDKGTEMRDEEDCAEEQLNLLNTEIQFLEENSISNSNDSSSQEKQAAFLTEDGKVCFISSFDENAFLTMS